MSRKKRSRKGRKDDRRASVQAQEASHLPGERSERGSGDRDQPDRRLEQAVQRPAGPSLPARADFLARNWRTIVAAGVIIIAGAIAYSNSFAGVYIFDDTTSIPKNPHIRSLWPIREAMKAPSQQTADGRPILCLSLAINYRISKLEVWSYHLVNLLIHLGCGLLLYGIIRRTLLTAKLAGTLGQAAWPLALICAAIWLLHPLNTGSVTYIIQRAESLMGLFYLAALYLAIRGYTSPAGVARWWFTGSVLACGIGMGCKEVMFTAPMIVLAYDLIFIARRPVEAFRKRWVFYVALAATWSILFALVREGPRHESVSFHFEGLTAWDYAVTQCNVIIHYLKLCFWPTKLSLDYDWPIARQFADYAANGFVLGVLLLGVAVLVAARPKWGFVGLWVFLILGPTSSFLPIATEVAAEHRMYLPLIAPIVGVVLGAYLVARLLATRNGSLARPVVGVCLALAVGLAVVFGAMTYRRNIDYRSRIVIWRDVTEKLPGNSRGHHNLGVALADAERHGEAIEHYDAAIRIRANYVAALAHRGASYNKLDEHDKALADFEHVLTLDPNNEKAKIGRGVAAQALGQLDEAIERFMEAAASHPDSAIAWNNLGSTYSRKGDYDKAIQCFTKAIEVDPAFANAWINRGVTYTNKDEWDKAVSDYSEAIRLDPKHVEAHNNRGSAYEKLGRLDEALADFEKAIELKPSLAVAYKGRGSVYLAKKDFQRALADYDKLVELEPGEAASYIARGNAYGTAGRRAEAIADFLKAVETEPDSFAACSSAAIAYRDSGNFAEAEKFFAKALDLKPDNAATYNNRGISRGKSGAYDLAIQDFTKAIELDATYAMAYNNRGMAWGNLGKYDKALADFSKAVEIDPEFLTAYWHIAVAKDGLGDRPGAIADLQAALRLAKRQNQQQTVAAIKKQLQAYGAPAE